MMRSILHGLGPALLMVCAIPAFGQNEDDALRYSWLLPGGTARSWGLGGAMGAVGADPGSSSLNPAGFGLYNTTELSITPGMEVNNADAQYYGTAASATRSHGFVNNFALVLCYPGANNSSWRSTVFGLSFDREASYQWERSAVGNRVNSTMLQHFVNEAAGTDPADLYIDLPYTSSLAWDTYAIDPLDTVNHTYSSQIPYGSDVRQLHTINSDGRSQTTSLFFAANWLDRLYLGASLGLIGVRYNRETIHNETSLVDTLDLGNFTYAEQLATTGSGVDLKVGVIGRVTDRLRLGFSFHSPKWMQMDDLYYTRMNTAFRTPDSDGNYNYSAQSPESTFRYRVNSPWNLLASAAYVAGKNGLVSVDYAYTDFRHMRLRGDNMVPDSYDFSMENAVIEADFQGAHSVRVGTEWRAGNWYFRGGWAWSQDPYNEEALRRGTGYKRYCAGTGYRTTHLSVDLAFTYGQRSGSYYQYDPSLVEPTTETLTDTRGLLTIAYRP